MKTSLFKYFHPDRSDILRNGAIRFSSPKVLNDPFELKPYISAIAPQGHMFSNIDELLPKIFKEEYEKLPAEFRARITFPTYLSLGYARLPDAMVEIESVADMMLPMLRDTLSKKIEEFIGILCLTETPTNLLMWAHYADSHQGFVVEFDPNSPFFDQRVSPEDEFRHIRKVHYHDERPALKLSEIEDFSPFLTKGSDWSYENEWRMLDLLSNASQIIGSGSAAVHLFDFPKSAIKAVIFGCRMADTKKTEICQILRDCDEYSHVRCAEARIDEKHYRVSLSETDRFM